MLAGENFKKTWIPSDWILRVFRKDGGLKKLTPRPMGVSWEAGKGREGGDMRKVVCSYHTHPVSPAYSYELDTASIDNHT